MTLTNTLTMTDEDKIKGKIVELQSELSTLRSRHQALNEQQTKAEQEYRVAAAANLNRFQQINGAIESLTQLLNQPNGEKPT